MKGISVRSRPTPVAPRGQAEPGLCRGCHVAEQGDLLAVRGARGRGGARRSAVRPRRAGPGTPLAMAAHGCAAEPGDGGQFLRRGVDDEAAVHRVQDGRVPGGRRRAPPGSAPASMGMPSPRAMIAAWELAPPETDTAPASPASAKRIRSAGSTSRRTRMKLPAGRRRGAAAGQVGEHGAGDLAHVVGAGGQVRVGQCGDRRGLRGG